MASHEISKSFVDQIFDGEMEEYPLEGIKAALTGISRTRPSGSHYETQRLWDEFFHQAGIDLCGLVLALDNLEDRPKKVQFIAGSRELFGRQIRVENGEIMLLGPARIESGESLQIDVARPHFVAQDFARYDMPNGHADTLQIFASSLTSKKAVSLNQISNALLDGGDLRFMDLQDPTLYPNP